MAKFWSRVLVAVLLVGTLPVLPSTAAERPPQAQRSGLRTRPLGLGPGQVARLIVFGLDPSLGPVALRLLIKNRAGTTLATLDASLDAGQRVTLELPRSAVTPATGRVPVHGEVECRVVNPGEQCPLLRARLEIFNAASGQVDAFTTAGPARPVPSTEPGDPIIPQ